MKQFSVRFVIVGAVLAFHSCTIRDTVVSRHYSDQPAKAHTLSHVGKTHWSFFWGLIRDEDWPAGCQEGSNISRARAVTNPVGHCCATKNGVGL
jgi:hypothetical protein